MESDDGMAHDGSLTIASRTAFFCALAALNVAVISFHVLWRIADNVAVNRAEEHGFDPSQLLPHAIPFWFAAHASLLSLLALDVLVFLAWRRSRHHVPRQPDVVNGPPPHDRVARQ